MLLSVIIPTCNRNELLGKCLDRLMPGTQTLAADAYEVIVSDDGAGEGAETFCRQRYPWVRYVRGPRRGPAANRNNGASLAVSEWLVFLDDDCLPYVDILASYKNCINKAFNVKVIEGVIEVPCVKPSPGDYAPLKLEGGALLSCNFSIKSEFFFQIEGFDENFRYAHMEDMDLQKRILDTGTEILFLPNAKVLHPWRKLSSGRTLGIREECLYYFHIKHGIPFSIMNFSKRLFFFYFKRIQNSFSVFNTFWLGKEFLIHLITVIILQASWKRKYGTIT